MISLIWTGFTLHHPEANPNPANFYVNSPHSYPDAAWIDSKSEGRWAKPIPPRPVVEPQSPSPAPLAPQAERKHSILIDIASYEVQVISLYSMIVSKTNLIRLNGISQ